MTVPTDKMYPVRATNAAWQKTGSLDKATATTQTGLGARLTKAENEWKLIRFQKLEASKLKQWKVDGGRHVMARAEKATVLARFKDGAKFANELTLSEIKAARSRCGVDGRRRTAGRRA